MPRRGDHIHRRKDGRWEGRFPNGRDSCGHVTYSSVYGHSYTEVRRKLAMAPARTHLTGKGERTVADVLHLWLDSQRVRLKRSTQDKYEGLIRRHITPALGSVRISRITAAAINAFLEQKLTEGRLDKHGCLAPSYVRTMAIILQSALRYAAEEQYCPPLHTPIQKPVSGKAEITLFTGEERAALERFLTAANDLTALGVMISLYTGLRIGEVCALRWSDIDFSEQTLTVRQTTVRVNEDGKNKWKLERPKTEASCRTIPLAPKLTELMERYYKCRKSAFVISDAKSFINPRTYDYRYHALLKSCGVSPLKYHTLRHTFASCAIQCGMDVKTLSELLGHADSAVTLRTYVHTSMEQKRAQLEKLAYVPA